MLYNTLTFVASYLSAVGVHYSELPLLLPGAHTHKHIHTIHCNDGRFHVLPTIPALKVQYIKAHNIKLMGDL